MVNPDEGNLRSNVFWIWGALCVSTGVFTYFMVPETKVRFMLKFYSVHKKVVWH
jgi:hypothetical protein